MLCEARNNDLKGVSLLWSLAFTWGCRPGSQSRLCSAHGCVSSPWTQLSCESSQGFPKTAAPLFPYKEAAPGKQGAGTTQRPDWHQGQHHPQLQTPGSSEPPSLWVCNWCLMEVQAHSHINMYHSGYLSRLCARGKPELSACASQGQDFGSQLV